jgi:hypothetical protein
MKLPNEQQEGADAAQGAIGGDYDMEPLFGDERWIDERIKVLRAQSGAGERRASR